MTNELDANHIFQIFFWKRRNTEQNKQGEEKKKIVLGDLQKNWRRNTEIIRSCWGQQKSSNFNDILVLLYEKSRVPSRRCYMYRQQHTNIKEIKWYKLKEREKLREKCKSIIDWIFEKKTSSHLITGSTLWRGCHIINEQMNPVSTSICTHN